MELPLLPHAQSFTNSQGPMLKCPSAQIWADAYLPQFRTHHCHPSVSALSLETVILSPALGLPAASDTAGPTVAGLTAERGLTYFLNIRCTVSRLGLTCL